MPKINQASKIIRAGAIVSKVMNAGVVRWQIPAPPSPAPSPTFMPTIAIGTGII